MPFRTYLIPPTLVEAAKNAGDRCGRPARPALEQDPTGSAVLKAQNTNVQRQVLNAAAFPELEELQWHYLRADQDGVLYASNSAGCDHCEPESDQAATIVRFNADACFAPEAYVRGVGLIQGFWIIRCTDPNPASLFADRHPIKQHAMQS